ncbi:hypothetical protein Tcan_05662 [Toxocara canis]|uniref:Uncharacterized protein n=1 Tax=Toxocara canis TaxID=6265 RepID=A0A0B2UWQ0_TOXCA|nr:hypothetical protein Tcan_05662 [Toxocara canis]
MLYHGALSSILILCGWALALAWEDRPGLIRVRLTDILKFAPAAVIPHGSRTHNFKGFDMEPLVQSAFVGSYPPPGSGTLSRFPFRTILIIIRNGYVCHYRTLFPPETFVEILNVLEYTHFRFDQAAGGVVVDAVCDIQRPGIIVGAVCDIWPTGTIVDASCDLWPGGITVDAVCDLWPAGIIVDALCDLWLAGIIVGAVCDIWPAGMLVAAVCDLWPGGIIVDAVCDLFSAI